MVATLQVYLEKINAPPSWSSKSLIRGIGKRYFTVIRFMALLSTDILQLPSFFGVNKAGTAQGLKLGLICPFFSNSSTCVCNASNSFGNEVNVGGKPLGASQSNVVCFVKVAAPLVLSLAEGIRQIVLAPSPELLQLELPWTSQQQLARGYLSPFLSRETCH